MHTLVSQAQDANVQGGCDFNLYTRGHLRFVWIKTALITGQTKCITVKND